MAKKKVQGFPHDVMEMLIFKTEFKDLDSNMSHPFRQTTRQVSQIAGDSFYALLQSKGELDKFLAGQLRVAMDNLDSIPALFKNVILGNMQTTIKNIVKDAPKGK